MIRRTHIGVYALITDQQNVLVIEKARGPYTGKFDLPGGSFEYGESALQTLTREVKEETGLTVKSSRLVDVLTCTVEYTDAHGEACSMHHIGIIYSVTVGPEALKAGGDGEDAKGAAWHPVSAINAASYSPFVCQSKELLSA